MSDRALDSETAAKATERLLDNETSKRVWDTVLESDEAQKLVERVADAPEVRAAIAKQGIGLVEDLRRGVRARPHAGSTPRRGWPAGFSAGPSGSAARSSPAPSAGCSRWRIDAGVVYGSLLLITAAIAALITSSRRATSTPGPS